MCTFNGQNYLKEQIDSILNQEEVFVHLAIRDDASIDNTVKILNDYKILYPEQFTLFLDSRNIYPLSLKKLRTLMSPEGFDYFSYSDQDDFWLPRKLINAIDKLDSYPKDTPNLYLSNLKVTDKDLNFRFYSYYSNEINPTINSCFVDFSASANTFVFNRTALNLFMDSECRKYVFDDVWNYILCVFLGNVFYEKESYILFRRTGNNVSGPREKGIKLWIMRIRKIKKELKSGIKMRADIATDILKMFSFQLSKEKIEILNLIANYPTSFKCRIKLLFSKKVKSKSFSKNLCMFARILINRF